MVKTPQTLSELLLTYSSKLFVTSLERRLLLVPRTHFTLKAFFFGIWVVACVFFNICFILFLLCILLGVNHLVTLSVKCAL